jgi:hypothetical protein
MYVARTRVLTAFRTALLVQKLEIGGEADVKVLIIVEIHQLEEGASPFEDVLL